MRIALLGKGKTGSQILELAPEAVVFDRTNKPTAEKLKDFDVVISFLPGDAFLELIPELMDSGRPVVTGSTGFNWPDKIDLKLIDKKLTWIYASNFSLGIVAMKQLIAHFNKLCHLFPEKRLSIHEVHHTKKVDAPSGTALSMKEWLGQEVEVTSDRTGDVVGLHTLTLETPSEIIRLEHEAKNRMLFAEGALWAAREIKNVKPGLHSFQSVVETHLSL